MAENRVLRGVAGAEANRRKLEAYLADLKQRGEKLPEQDGGPNLSRIAAVTTIGRNALYSESLQALLKDAVATIGLECTRPVGAAATDPQEDTAPVSKGADPRDRLIQRLQTRNAELMAENASLREQLKQANAVVNELIPNGRRIHPGFLGAEDG
jgi:hypothetical protein